MRRFLLIIACTAILSGCTTTDFTPEGGPPTPTVSPIPPSTASSTPTSEPSSTPFPTYTPEPTPTPTCEHPEGHLTKVSYLGVRVDTSIAVLVFLPPCYELTTGVYPALYVLHGYPYDQSHWDDLGLDEAAGEAMRLGTIPPFLIIMPYQPEPLFTGSDGGRWSYEAEFTQGLVPFVDQGYRTEQAPSSRAIAGISRGGIWALEIGLRHPDLFDAVVGLSPSLAVNYARPTYDPFTIVQQREILPERVLLLAGSDDWARSKTAQLSRALEGRITESVLSIAPGRHEDALWRSAIPEVLDFVSAGWAGAQ